MQEDNKEISNSKSRRGPKSGAQTPAKPSEKKKGSSKNKPGSAGKDGPSITFSEKVITALKNKVSEHNKKHPSKKVTLSQLKKIYRRGAGAFSTSHRPGMTRGGWAMARVNMFLKMKRGGKVKKSYRAADQDVASSIYEDLPKPTVEDCIAANLYLQKQGITQDFTDEDIFPEIEEDGFEEYVSEESWAEAKNKGKTLNKPFRTSSGPKKFSVYVKNEKGNVVKVNFGDPNMEIKRDDPARRKSFRARHNCDNPGPKTKARYWSCKQWRAGTKVKGSGDEGEEELLWHLDESEGERKGLWHNIREKKRRMGKNYRPAKPGDKDRPSQKALKKAQGLKNKKDNTKSMKNEKETSEAEVSEAMKMKDDAVYKKFMAVCAMDDKALVNTKGMDDKMTAKTCAMQYKKMSAMMKYNGAGLTPAQKKLPAPLQKAILQKMGKEGKDDKGEEKESKE